MQVRTESLVTDGIVATEGATIDLRPAARFFVPQMATAELPAPGTVPGMLVWDTTTSSLRLAIGSTWETIALVV